MRIKHLKLYRFRGFEDLQITFSADAKTIVFIGENGSGKTSLIDGISMILREALYKHHQYDAVDWGNPLNVNNNHRRGKIELGIHGAKREYSFSQRLSANHQKFVSEERLARDLGRDLTDEEKIAHYRTQASEAFDADNFELALKKYEILAELLEKQKPKNEEKIAKNIFNIAMSYQSSKNYDNAINTYFAYIEITKKLEVFDKYFNSQAFYNIGFCYLMLNDYLKAFEYCEKVVKMRKFFIDDRDIVLASSYHLLALCSLNLAEHKNKALDYAQKSINIYQNIYEEDEEEMCMMYHLLGSCYFIDNNYQKADEYYEKAIKIAEKEENFMVLNYLLEEILNRYQTINNKEKSNYFAKKIRKDVPSITEERPYVPELYLTNKPEMLKHFTEYIETWVSLVVHYSARHGEVELFKNALPIAFDVPMTTNFDMISDWFTEHENDENRKRLRVDPDYRSTELEIVREVILRGLTLLNGGENHFTELQTEIEETVRDGQVSTWLSVRKDNTRLNVKQLSDGEKRVLILLIDIARRLITVGKSNKDTHYLEGKGVVLIDEIEQHLHPKWQRNLLPTLRTIFPNLQFVVTTHSPQILSYVPNGCAYALENWKAYPQNTFGRNNDWILETIMQDVNRPKEVQEKIEAYFDAIREDKTEEARTLRTWLEKEIGADEPELLKADILIRRKKTSTKNEANPQTA